MRIYLRLNAMLAILSPVLLSGCTTKLRMEPVSPRPNKRILGDRKR